MARRPSVVVESEIIYTKVSGVWYACLGPAPGKRRRGVAGRTRREAYDRLARLVRKSPHGAL